MESQEIKDIHTTTRPTPKDLLLKILKDAKVTPEILDDGGVVFHYGDEHNDEVIVARSDSSNRFISFYDYNWHEISQWDIEAVTELQNKINLRNIGNRVKIVYYFNDDDKMLLTSIARVPFTENIPDLSGLMSAELQCLVESHNIIPKDDTVEEIVSDENKEEGEKQ